MLFPSVSFHTNKDKDDSIFISERSSFSKFWKSLPSSLHIIYRHFSFNYSIISTTFRNKTLNYGGTLITSTERDCVCTHVHQYTFELLIFTTGDTFLSSIAFDKDLWIKIIGKGILSVFLWDTQQIIFAEC